ncbi:MAG: ferredoxin [Planctomycetes bacterium]|nr:ferredoxin [Planctomycetota bacterium]MBL7106624.1 ferredoxin [Phycisphaerae bacterium]
MKAIVDDNCTGCGLCCQTCPEVFQLSDDMAEVIADPIPEDVQDTAQQAADECPVDAITIE